MIIDKVCKICKEKAEHVFFEDGELLFYCEDHYNEKFDDDGWEYKNNDEITCPWCGDKWGDSWECSDVDEIVCEECAMPFGYEREVEVTYPSYRLRGGEFYVAIQKVREELKKELHNEDADISHCVDIMNKALKAQEAREKEERRQEHLKFIKEFDKKVGDTK